MPKKTQRFDPRQNMNGDTYEIFHYLDIQTRHLDAHYHDFYELFFFIDGDVDYWVDGDVYHLQPGDLLLIHPTALHKPIPRTDTNVYERIVLWISRPYLASIEGGLFQECFDTSNQDQPRLLRLSAGEKGRVHPLLHDLVKEFYSDRFAAKSCAYGLLLQLLTAINRIARRRDTASAEAYSTPTFISDILAYIGTHYQEDLTLDRLAAHFFINKYYLSHEFKKAVGTGVHRYITLKRLNSAYDLLQEGHAPGPVSLQCGFSDYTAFYKAFMAEYGISPAACRHQSNP